MQTLDVPLKRVIVASSRTFDEVVASLFVGIGPMREKLASAAEASSYADYQKKIQSRLGSADLMEFVRLDLGSTLQIDPQARPFRALRILAGNPLILKQMLQTVPHAGSYAPVTLLVYQDGAKVCIAYDLMASAIAIYNSAEATRVAEELDSKVIRLLHEAAGDTARNLDEPQ